MRVVPQEAAAPTAPPTRALPTKTAPPTIIGATLASGADSAEKEISDVDSETIIIIHEIIFFKLNRRLNYILFIKKLMVKIYKNYIITKWYTIYQQYYMKVIPT
jgi:hypothetical protein